MFHQLYDNVYRWTERHGKPETTYYWYSFAVHIKQAGIFALIDPLPMSAEEIVEIEKIGRPTHILLTCNWHLRVGEQYRQRWNCEIYINKRGLAEAETQIHGTFRHGEKLWDVVEIIHLPDVSWKEETAFLIHQDKGLLIIGDAVCGGRADIGIPDREIGVHPIDRMATFQNEGARKTLGDLMEYLFDAICFGHGTPILSNAKAALQRFIDTCRNPVLRNKV